MPNNEPDHVESEEESSSDEKEVPKGKKKESPKTLKRKREEGPDDEPPKKPRKRVARKEDLINQLEKQTKLTNDSVQSCMTIINCNKEMTAKANELEVLSNRQKETLNSQSALIAAWQKDNEEIRKELAFYKKQYNDKEKKDVPEKPSVKETK